MNNKKQGAPAEASVAKNGCLPPMENPLDRELRQCGTSFLEAAEPDVEIIPPTAFAGQQRTFPNKKNPTNIVRKVPHVCAAPGPRCHKAGQPASLRVGAAVRSVLYLRYSSVPDRMAPTHSSGCRVRPDPAS